VFTRIDGLYSALIMDLHSEGVERGVEEKKMGQRGSSTTALAFTDVKVPVENLLGEIGDASTIALNILNLGRHKLGLACLGTSKVAIEKAITYASARKQFGQPIVSFDMQKARLADMITQVYAVDSICYRTAGVIDEVRETLSGSEQEAKVEAVRRYAMEASCVKVLGSETLHAVAREAIFMHGGYGYLDEYHVERMYRDNIVDMIYEGTNDINRMVIFDDLVRNIFRSGIPFRENIELLEHRIRTEQMEYPLDDAMPSELVAAAKRVAAAKEAVLYTLNHALIHCGKNIKAEQQVMREVSNSVIALYAMDSSVARAADRLISDPSVAAEEVVACVELIVHDGVSSIRDHTTNTLLACVKGAELERKLDTLEGLHLRMRSRIPVAELKRVVAECAIEAGKYPF